MKLFKGKIAHCKKEVLTHTSGTTKISTNALTERVSGSGNIQTHHEHYTNFDIDDVSFRCNGDYAFKDGDSVALGAWNTNQGFYQVEILKNATRNFYFSKLRKRFPPFAFLGGFFGGLFGSAFLWWIVWWDLNKFIFNGTILNSNLAACIYLIAVVLSGLFVGRQSFVNARDERETTLYFEKEIKDYQE